MTVETSDILTVKPATVLPGNSSNGGFRLSKLAMM